ncbi:MAG: hypothetical protein V4549_00410 [Bacteroidota bacterium]
MNEIKFYEMRGYCEQVKKYFESYNNNPLSVSTYGDAKQKLRDLINKPDSEDINFFLNVVELLGAVTRVLRGQNDNPPVLDWIGGATQEESFSKEYFVKTMKEVWPAL